jgi:undecaprenyl-diphosphatase
MHKDTVLDPPPNLFPSAARRIEIRGTAGFRARQACGLAIFIVATSCIALIEMLPSGGWGDRIDLALAGWIKSHANSGVTEAMLDISQMHAPYGIAAMCAGLALYFALRHERHWLCALAIAMPACMLAQQAFRLAGFGSALPASTLSLSGMPSAHVANSTLLYGLLAAYLAHRIDPWLIRAATVLICTAMVALVALSRLYLGAHYIGEIAAGALEGIAWLALTWVTGNSVRERLATRSARLG